MRISAMTGFGLVCAAGLALPGTALGGPPVSGHIDPGAKWVVHVDLEQMDSTQIGSFLMEMLAEEADGFADIKEVMPNFWPGPEGGMFGVTLYGTSLDMEENEVPEGFCAVVYGDERISGWGSMLEAIALHEGIEDQLKKRNIHGSDVWSVPIDEGGRLYAGLVEGQGGQVAWVVSFDDGDIDRALATFADQSGGSELMPRDGWREGTIAFVATNALGEVPMDEKASRVIGEARSLKLRVGELGDEAFLQMALDTGDAEKAKSVMSIGQGLMAIGHLAAGEDEELAAVMEIVQGVELTTGDTSVMLNFAHNADEVLDFLKDAVENEWPDDAHDDHGHGDGDDRDDDGGGVKSW